MTGAPPVVVLHVVSDALIIASGYSIALTMIVFLLRRGDVALRWVGWIVALSIAAWGSTRLFDILTIWAPDYWDEGLFKAATAALSLFAAAWLWCLLPRMLTLPSAAELRRANTHLAEQIEQRDAALLALQRETAERVRAEEMLRQSQKMEALGKLTGGVAHDFNNVLMVVQGNLEILGRRIDAADPLRAYIERAARGAERGAGLIQQLLAFARRQNLQPARFDMNARMADFAELLRGSLGSDIAVDWRIATGLWTVEADPGQLDATLLNLAVNARDAMPRGGRLEVSVSNTRSEKPVSTVGGDMGAGDYVSIRVADTGIGMTREVRDSAFEPFFTTKDVGKGSGLGLSQVYGFVKQSRGHILIDSAPGKGTAVTIHLPRADAG